MALLPLNHFLSLPRPDVLVGPPVGAVDTTTLAAHDFDVDTRTGFMPPDPPLTRLPAQWELWEQLLDDARLHRLQLGSKVGITEEEKARSESWRARVSQLPTLPTAELSQSELLLRRAHHVLAWNMHFYIHSLPPDAEIRIPSPITVPLLQVCVQLQLPPVITYSDDVLYNWALKVPSADPTPALHNLRSLTLFTGKRDEEEFYLASARIELRGVDALEIMRATMDELFVGDDLAAHRITRYLHSLVRVIDDLTRLLLAVRDGCEPETFNREIRPWFNGADSGSRKWTFEGLAEHPELVLPTELSGPSAAQSSLIQALDAFLGVNHTPSPTSSPSSSSALSPTSPSAPPFGPSSPTTPTPEAGPSGAYAPPKVPFLTRMRSYMPRHHRNFLQHLSAAPRPLRTEVTRMGDAALTEAYNAAVDALRRFRDAHMRIVALYIIGPSRRAPPHVHASVAHDQAGPIAEACEGQGHTGMGITMKTGSMSTAGPSSLLRGTGGTDLVRFLKGVRDRTSGAAIGRDSAQ